MNKSCLGVGMLLCSVRSVCVVTSVRGEYFDAVYLGFDDPVKSRDSTLGLHCVDFHVATDDEIINYCSLLIYTLKHNGVVRASYHSAGGRS